MQSFIENPITTRFLKAYKLLKDGGIVNNQVNFCEEFKINTSAFNEIVKKKRNMPTKYIPAICKKYNINIEYIHEGREPMFLNGGGLGVKTDISNVKMVDISEPKKNLTIVPLKAFGGLLNGYANKIYMDTLEKVPFPFIRGECFAFEVEGFSMYVSKIFEGEIFERGYKPQSYVVCTPIEGLDHMVKDKDYVFQTVDGIILKTYVKMDDKLCHLKAINDDYNPTKPMPLKSIKKVYFVERKL